MNTQQSLGERELIIAALVALVLTACGTRKNQGQISSVETRPAMQLAQRNARESSLKPGATHAPSRNLTVSHHVLSGDRGNAASHDENPPKTNTAAVLSQIHQADLTEIALGKLAENKASAPEVRAYADQLVHDHLSLDATVVAMALKKAAHLPNQPRPSLQGRKGMRRTVKPEQKLTAANGSTFDQLFLEQAGSDHQKLIRALQQQREDTEDDEVEALIDTIVPILEQHEELAQILMKKERA